MKAKSLIVLSVLFAASAAAGFVTFSPSVETPLNATGEPHALWVSPAETVAEQALEADIIVRVQVTGQGATRAVSVIDDAANVARARGLRSPALPFTDSEVEVLQVYRGDLAAGDRIALLQTGGYLDGNKLELREDPLFEVGGEHVLFLVDVSGDPVHAADGRQLFRIINPASRYDLAGDQVSRLGDFTKASRIDGLANLEAEIDAAITQLGY